MMKKYISTQFSLRPHSPPLPAGLYYLTVVTPTATTQHRVVAR